MEPAERVSRGAVVLRRWRGDDVDELCRVVGESLAHLTPWMEWATADYDRSAAADYLAGCPGNWADGRSYGYAITVGGKLIGACGLERRIGPGGLELGYWLHPAHTGRGYATAAAGALVGQAFALPDIERVQIWHDAANEASAGVPRRLGFTEVARRTPPRTPLTPGEVGIDVIWELTAEQRGRSAGL